MGHVIHSDDYVRIEATINPGGSSATFEFTFFTPDGVANQMVSLVRNPEEVYSLLEPSAGTGALVRAAARGLPRLPNHIQCVENDRKLASQLRWQGYSVSTEDFLKWTPKMRYDLILMSPPFEKGGGFVHIKRAFDKCMSLNGQLIALAGPAIMDHTYSRMWINNRATDVIELPETTFKYGPALVKALMIRLTNEKILDQVKGSYLEYDV